MKMRIVGMTGSKFFIQTLYNGTWIQEKITFAEFAEFMKEHFPAVFEQLGDNWDAYYNYGETEEMRRKGEAYIFESEE